MQISEYSVVRGWARPLLSCLSTRNGSPIPRDVPAEALRCHRPEPLLDRNTLFDKLGPAILARLGRAILLWKVFIGVPIKIEHYRAYLRVKMMRCSVSIFACARLNALRVFRIDRDTIPLAPK